MEEEKVHVYFSNAEYEEPFEWRFRLAEDSFIATCPDWMRERIFLVPREAYDRWRRIEDEFYDTRDEIDAFVSKSEGRIPRKSPGLPPA